MRQELSIAVYAPELAAGDARAPVVVRALERAIPFGLLAWELTRSGAVPLLDRDRWLTTHTKGGGFPLLCNGDETHPVTIDGSAVSAHGGPGGQPLTHIHAHLPLDEKGVKTGPAALGAIADGAQAYWGVASPFSTSVEIAEQVAHAGHGRHPPLLPPRGLPALKRQFELAAAAIPGRLGWINYWSPAAAAAIGFPHPTRDADLLASARRTACGAWIVPLSEEPLDLDVPAHLEALRLAYDRFPAIGGREAQGR